MKTAQVAVVKLRSEKRRHSESKEAAENAFAMASWSENIPRRLKPHSFSITYGTAKAVPIQSREFARRVHSFEWARILQSEMFRYADNCLFFMSGSLDLSFSMSW